MNLADLQLKFNAIKQNWDDFQGTIKGINQQINPITGLPGNIAAAAKAGLGAVGKATQFLAPQGEEEAKEMGLLKIPGTEKYLDPTAAIGSLRVVGGRVAEPIKNVILKKGKELLGKVKLPTELQPLAEEAKILRGTAGMTAEDIMKKYPNIQLKKEIAATDVYGNKVKIPKGQALTPYELTDNKILLQDGETYIVSKSQFQNSNVKLQKPPF